MMKVESKCPMHSKLAVIENPKKTVNWNGIMRVLEIRHADACGNILWEKSDINNLLHNSGEQFILQALFTGGPSNSFIPNYYFLGLDNRTALDPADTMTALVGEPNTNGYVRQPVNSINGFTIDNSSGSYRATTAIVTFRATGGTWGPVQNIFITDKNDLTGFLIASANLGSPFSLTDGDTISLRLGMTLQDCPPTS
jgi:hypothetical protein